MNKPVVPTKQFQFQFQTFTSSGLGYPGWPGFEAKPSKAFTTQ